jgi:hypothetical protein
MASEPQNPLLPPEISSQPNLGLPPPTRARWTPAERVQVLLGFLTLVFVVIQTVPVVRASLPSVTQFSVYAIGVLVILGSFLLVLGLSSALERRLQRRRERESASASPDRVTELAVLVGKARQTWSIGLGYANSFEHAASDITNALNSSPMQLPTTPEERKRAGDRACFLFYGWRGSSAARDGLFWELERLIDDLRTTDRETFVTALLLLRQILLGSLQVASSFADEVRRCGPEFVPEYARATWTDFREKANLLSSEVNTLGEKTKRDYGRSDLSFYFPSVRAVSPA